MNVTYSGEIDRQSEGFALLQQLTRFLEQDVFERAAKRVTVGWDYANDVPEGPCRYTLKLSDGSDSASACFAPDELELSIGTRLRLRHLWGEVLRLKNERLLLELQQTE